ncbi:MAG TPA: endonuclease [Nocardioidaceae bacterium]|nr:endonuclease [Nocardioidaceae bacterium]
MTQRDIATTLLDRHGRTFADEAGITLRDKPAPLWQLLVLSLLASARISSDIATAAATELFKAGYRTPRKMCEATWQQRVDALGRGHYRRYDERTSTMLGECAEMLLDEHGGDLRKIHDGDTSDIEGALQAFKGVGPTGAAIFCREVQGVWPDLAPYIDKRTGDGAERLGLPRDAERLAKLVDASDLSRLVAGCVRAAGDKGLVEDVRDHA